MKREQLEDLFFKWGCEHSDKAESIDEVELRLLTDHLVSRYMEMRELQSKIKQMQDSKLETLEYLKEQAAGFDKEVELLRMGCRHPVSTYHTDPSGGNDSYYECVLCGAVLN